MPQSRERKAAKPALVIVLISALVPAIGTCAAAWGQQLKIDYDIIGPPSQGLRRTIAGSAGDLLPDLPVVKGSEISDEIGLRTAQKLHAVCVRWTSPDKAGGTSAFSVMGVTLVQGLPQQVFADYFACQDPRLKFYPFPEMR